MQRSHVPLNDGQKLVFQDLTKAIAMMVATVQESPAWGFEFELRVKVTICIKVRFGFNLSIRVHAT
jgi:hypothetical protein